MPDRRSHRGAAPKDDLVFHPDRWPVLRRAVGHLSWLLSRGYSEGAALKLVGDRFSLVSRQRTAVRRAASPGASAAHRAATEVSPREIRGESLLVDGYNVLTTLEAALAGGILLRARDGCVRDMASMHGSYRRVAETVPAIELAIGLLVELGAAGAVWYLDRPVSNSGRLKGLVLEGATAVGFPVEVLLVPDPDPILAGAPRIVVTADRIILDACRRWFNLTGEVLRRRIPDARLVDLSRDDAPEAPPGPR